MLSAMIGIVALIYPFVVGVVQVSDAAATTLQMNQTPLLTATLIALCLGVLLVELQGQVGNAKTIAVLGLLISITATLRFIEVGIPGPGGFSPIFVPIMLGGFVFGSRFGFLLGAMSMLVSAILTAGIGPWLPYQMFTAGWIGLTAGWLPRPRSGAQQLLILIVFGIVWGFLYGAVLNLYNWPYLAGDPAMSWQAGEGLRSGVSSYAAYYVVTSLVWDSLAAAGNAVLLIILGVPTIRALDRFRDRLTFEVRPV